MAAADKVVTPPAVVEELLALIDPIRGPIEALQAQIDPLKAQQNQWYERRAEVFLRLRTEAPDVSFARIAERAGVSVPAVIQQVAKAKERAAAAALAADDEVPEP